MPEMVRIFRLIAAPSRGSGYDEIRWMVYQSRAGLRSSAFGNDVVTIIRIASGASWCAWGRARFGDKGRRPAQFHHGDPVRTHRKQSEAPADRMCDERFEVLGSHGLKIAIDFGVFGALPVQTRSPYFVQDDAGQFRTAANDGRIGADLLEISEHLGNGGDHIRARSGSLGAAAHRERGELIITMF